MQSRFTAMIRHTPYVLFLLLFAVLLTGCDSTENDPIRILVPRDVPNSQYTTTESGLRYYDFEVGNGAEAGDSSVVEVHYASWLNNGDIIGGTYTRQNPIEVDLASSDVVEGFAEGVRGMRVGGERQLVVPPSLAYGEEGLPDAGIPSNATIIYEVELISVEAD